MKYLSVCSGIEAASVAWHHLGWEPVGFAEIEKFPSQVLAHRFPDVPNFGDMTKYKEWNLEPGTIDILVGGTPCQAFSVAGLRKGLQDPRGNLALTFVAMVDHYRPEWVVWENVPGVLSSNGGRDFGSFLGALGQLGYGWAYRILDAQYFGVAQRRRRVFVVAHSSGDPRRCAEVLFEPESLRGDPAPSRETGQKTTADPRASTPGGGLWDTVGALCADTHPGAYSGQDAYTGRIIPSVHPETTSAITASMANSCLGHNKDENVIAIDALNQCLTGDVSKTMASRNDQDTASLVALPSLYELQPIGLDEEQNASINLFGTLMARTESGGFQGVVMQPSLYESHPQETQIVAGIPNVVGALTAKGPYAIGAPEVDANHYLPIVQPSLYESHPQDCRVTGPVKRCPTVSAKWGTGGNNTPLVTDGGTHFRKSKRAQSVDDDETWVESDVTNTMNVFDQGDVRATDVVVQPGEALPLAYDDRNQAVSADTHHTLRGYGAGSRVGDAIVQPDSDGVISFQSKLSFSSTSKDVAPTMSTEDVLATTQPGEASAFSWQCRGDMRGMVPHPTAQLQRCQIKAVMVPEQSGYETVPALTASGRGVERTGESRGQDPVVAVNQDAVQVQWASGGGQVENPTAQALRSNAEHNYQFVRQTMHVRRLTPVECERLQGFPDGWTDIRPNGKDTPDSPRYKALGNSMAVPVMRWIGMRIAEANRG